jgi:hypothetical protein
MGFGASRRCSGAHAEERIKLMAMTRGASPWAKCAVVGMLASVLAGGAYGLDLFGSTLTGTVRDATTKAPITGAYVVAVYYQSGGELFAHSARWCFRTRGMYTGTDGRYRFPTEGDGPPELKAIKPDYFENDARRWITEHHWNGDRQVQSPDLFLQRQDPATPTPTSIFDCERPTRPEYALANIEYLNISLADAEKYDSDDSLRWLWNTRRAIQRLGGHVPSAGAK